MKEKTKLKLKILYLLLGFITLTLTGCPKQSECDCGLTGKFVYNPYWSPGFNRTIEAHFIPDHDSDRYYRIVGFIPYDFRTTDTIRVNICTSVRELTRNQDDVCVVHKLKCIEKIY